MRNTLVSGRVWLLTDSSGRLHDDVDTDQIYHNRHLHVTSLDEMGRFALGNLAGWEHFARQAHPSDIVVAGRNFGAGSSRQHAVDCFVALGVSAIVAESFGAIYKRNAINSGFAIVEVPGLTGLVGDLSTGQNVGLDLRSGTLITASGRVIRGRPFSQVQMDIYLAGDLFEYGRSLSEGGVSLDASSGVSGRGGD